MVELLYKCENCKEIHDTKHAVYRCDNCNLEICDNCSYDIKSSELCKDCYDRENENGA